MLHTYQVTSENDFAGSLAGLRCPCIRQHAKIQACEQLKRQQGMLLIRIKGTGRGAQRREFFPVLCNKSPLFGAHISQEGCTLLLYMLTPSERINKKISVPSTFW